MSMMTSSIGIISVGDESYRTACIKKTLDPVWNEECVFTVKDGDDFLVLDVRVLCVVYQ